MVLVWYSPTAIYFGILAYDRDPALGRATLAKRDHIASDDQVTLYLDTFNDRRRAYFFGSNPYGVQDDGVRSEGGFSASAGMMSGDHRPQPRLYLADQGLQDRLRLCDRDADPLQVIALYRWRRTDLGHQRRRAPSSARASRTPGPTPGGPTHRSSHKLAQSRASTISSVAWWSSPAAVTATLPGSPDANGEYSREALETNLGGELPPRIHEFNARRDDQSRLLASGVGRRVGDDQ